MVPKNPSFQLSRRTRIAIALVILVVVLYGYSILTSEFKAAIKTNPTIPVYAELEQVELSSNTTIIAYNLTIPNSVDQNNESLFFVNGLTNMGYWFQIGIVTNPEPSGTNTPVHEIGIAVDRAFPDGSGALSNGFVYGGADISYGDKVLIEIYTKNNGTILYFKDWNKPGLARNFTFPNTGSYLTELGKNGSFTGLMSEYHYNTANATVSHPEVVYEPVNYTQQYVGLSISELRETPGPIVTLYQSRFLALPPGMTGQANASIYTEYYYPNGTFVTD